MRKIVAALGVMLAGGILLASAFVLSTPPASAQNAPPIVGHASWAEHYATVEDAVRAADEVVLGTVLSSRPGRMFNYGGVEVPFTNVSFQVITAIGGALHSGDTIVVEQTGGPTSRGLVVTSDDPPYSTGGTYFLLLRKNDVGYTIVAPVGRFSVQSGILKAVSDNGPGPQWSQKALASALDQSRLIRGR